MSRDPLDAKTDRGALPANAEGDAGSPAEGSVPPLDRAAIEERRTALTDQGFTASQIATIEREVPDLDVYVWPRFTQLGESDAISIIEARDRENKPVVFRTEDGMVMVTRMTEDYYELMTRDRFSIRPLNRLEPVRPWGASDPLGLSMPLHEKISWKTLLIPRGS